MVWLARWARTDTAVVKQTLDLIGRRSWARGLIIQIYTAGNGTLHSCGWYDYAKAIGVLKFLSLSQGLPYGRKFSRDPIFAEGPSSKILRSNFRR